MAFITPPTVAHDVGTACWLIVLEARTPTRRCHRNKSCHEQSCSKTTHAFAALSSPRDILRTSDGALARSRDALRQSRVTYFVSTRIFALSACTYRRSGSIPSRSTGVCIRVPASVPSRATRVVDRMKTFGDRCKDFVSLAPRSVDRAPYRVGRAAVSLARRLSRFTRAARTASRITRVVDRACPCVDRTPDKSILGQRAATIATSRGA